MIDWARISKAITDLRNRFVGFSKITVSATEPVNPSVNDIWIDIS